VRCTAQLATSPPFPSTLKTRKPRFGTSFLESSVTIEVRSQCAFLDFSRRRWQRDRTPSILFGHLRDRAQPSFQTPPPPPFTAPEDSRGKLLRSPRLNPFLLPPFLQAVRNSERISCLPSPSPASGESIARGNIFLSPFPLEDGQRGADFYSSLLLSFRDRNSDVPTLFFRPLLLSVLFSFFLWGLTVEGDLLTFSPFFPRGNKGSNLPRLLPQWLSFFLSRGWWRLRAPPIAFFFPSSACLYWLRDMLLLPPVISPLGNEIERLLFLLPPPLPFRSLP